MHVNDLMALHFHHISNSKLRKGGKDGGREGKREGRRGKEGKPRSKRTSSKMVARKTFSQGPLCQQQCLRKQSYNETVTKHIPQGHGGDSLSWRVSDLIKSRITGREL